jgi:lipopolysaccharide biosynthesis glycosyltransferase
MNIDIFSVSDKKPIDILYVQLNSIKQNKNKDTIINYDLIIEDVDSNFKEYFNDLISNDFNIQFLDARPYEKYINPPKKSYLYYVRCLAPIIFSGSSKILYLDTDILMINEGIEELWNTNIDNYYLAAAIDIEEAYRDEHERINVGKNIKDNNYFNTGVMLLNLTKLREYSTVIRDYLEHWPEGLECILYDQTLFNWMFKNGVKIIDSNYNNSILSMVEYDKPYYEQYYNTKNLLTKYKNACFLHFKGYKVWNEISKKIQKHLPHYKLGQIIYFIYYEKLSKKQYN